MKDATGELSMTAVAVVAIAAISVLFTTLIWPTIRTNILRSTYCAQAACPVPDGANLEVGDLIDCTYCTGEGDDMNCDNAIKCPLT